MKEIFTEENVKISVDALLEKSDSCGTDGIYVSQYKEFWELNEEKILNGILEGQYKPDAVKKIEILKTNGKKRILAQYTCTDRVILDVIKRKLTPMWEGKFSKYSFAYQENKGVQSAVKQAAQFIEEGRCWVAELDVENFFDHVNLERMESMLWKKITDESLMRLIHQYLYIMVAEEFKETRNIIGLLQGNPLSPLFSNIYMEQFDLYMEQNYSYCRFSDDINIYCKSQKEAEKAAEDVTRYLKKKLGLTCNKKKSGIYQALSRRYLGYEFYRVEGRKKIYVRRAKKKEEKSIIFRWKPVVLLIFIQRLHLAALFLSMQTRNT